MGTKQIIGLIMVIIFCIGLGYFTKLNNSWSEWASMWLISIGATIFIVVGIFLLLGKN
jgi:protein-S-isoprenylcysteine O-methyltransferase Ste14